MNHQNKMNVDDSKSISSFAIIDDENGQNAKNNIALLESKNQILEEKLVKQEMNTKMRETPAEQRKTERKKEMVKLARMLVPYTKWGIIFLCLFIFLYSIHSLKAKNQEEHMAIREKLKMTNDKLEQSIQTVGNKQLAMEQKLTILWSQFASKISNQSPIGNYWDRTNAQGQIYIDGLFAKNSDRHWEYVFAVQGFGTSAESRKKDFAGTVLYYFEVTKMSSQGSVTQYYFVGLSKGNAPSPDESVTSNPNSYMYGSREDHCWLSGQKHLLEPPNEAAKPWKFRLDTGDVIGCGLLLSSNNKVSIFFTGNGILLGKPIPISSSHSFVDPLFPTVAIWGTAVNANFGADTAAKPFKYNIDQCPGLVFEGI